MTNFLGISTGSSSISAGSQLFFQNFQGFTRFRGKKLVKRGSENVKIAKKAETEVDFSSILAKSCGIWPQETETGSRHA